jgi:hypothetical protein
VKERFAKTFPTEARQATSGKHLTSRRSGQTIGWECGVLHLRSVRLSLPFSGVAPQWHFMHDCHPQGILTTLRAPVYRILNKFRLAIISW